MKVHEYHICVRKHASVRGSLKSIELILKQGGNDKHLRAAGLLRLRLRHVSLILVPRECKVKELQQSSVSEARQFSKWSGSKLIDRGYYNEIILLNLIVLSWQFISYVVMENCDIERDKNAATFQLSCATSS